MIRLPTAVQQLAGLGESTSGRCAGPRGLLGSKADVRPESQCRCHEQKHQQRGCESLQHFKVFKWLPFLRLCMQVYDVMQALRGPIKHCCRMHLSYAWNGTQLRCKVNLQKKEDTDDAWEGPVTSTAAALGTKQQWKCLYRMRDGSPLRHLQAR
jgi:hypothetical protein